MGCDIHLFAEYKKAGAWHCASEAKGPKHPYYREDTNNKYFDINSWSPGRNYWLFGVLAGVRSRTISPITEPRGIPVDVSTKVAREWKSWGSGGSDGHTPSYYTIKELLDAKKQKQPFYGIVDIKNYKTFKKKGAPDNWFTSMQGELISNNEMDRIINLLAFWDGINYYTEIKWEMSNEFISPHFWNELIPAAQKLAKNPNNVRLVFWFDN